MSYKKLKPMDNEKPPEKIKDGGGKQHPSNPACPCKSCKKTINNSDPATQCSLCDDYYCTHCIGMTTKEYKALNSLDRKDVWWTCKQCLSTLMALKNNTSVPEINIMETLIEKLESQVSKKVNQLEGTMNTFMQNVTTTVNKLEQSVATTLDSKIDENHEKVQQTVTNISQEWEKTIQKTVNNLTEQCEKQIAKSFKQALSGNTDGNDTKEDSQEDKQESITGIMKDIIIAQRQEQEKEEREKEEREKNIIMYRATEVEGGEAKDRKKRDKDKIDEVLKAINRSDIQVKTFFRLGRFESDKHQQGKCRPVKIVLHSKEDRDSIMRNAFKISETEDESVRGIHLGYDMTLDERKAVEEKIAEANEKNANSTQFWWKVRGPPWALRLKREKRK